MIENSREEDIRTMKNIIKSYIEADECGLSNNDFKCEIQALSNILSDYKRVLKENEELKSDIANMYDEEVVISIISDNFNLSRNEVLELLGGN